MFLEDDRAARGAPHCPVGFLRDEVSEAGVSQPLTELRVVHVVDQITESGVGPLVRDHLCENPPVDTGSEGLGRLLYRRGLGTSSSSGTSSLGPLLRRETLLQRTLVGHGTILARAPFGLARREFSSLVVLEKGVDGPLGDQPRAFLVLALFRALDDTGAHLQVEVASVDGDQASLGHPLDVVAVAFGTREHVCCLLLYLVGPRVRGFREDNQK